MEGRKAMEGKKAMEDFGQDFKSVRFLKWEREEKKITVTNFQNV